MERIHTVSVNVALGVILVVMASGCGSSASRDGENSSMPPATNEVGSKESSGAPKAPVALLASFSQPASIDVIETPLGDLLKLLGSQHSIRISLDEPLRAQDAQRAYLVTRNIQGITLKSLLQIVLGDMGLDYVLDGDSITVVTPEAEKTRSTAVRAVTQQAKSAKSDTAAANEATLRKALQSPAEGQFTNEYLVDVLDVLRVRHGVPIYIDQRALSRSGIAPDASVSANVSGKTLDEALRAILANLKLKHGIQHEVIWITTP